MTRWASSSLLVLVFALGLQADKFQAKANPAIGIASLALAATSLTLSRLEKPNGGGEGRLIYTMNPDGCFDGGVRTSCTKWTPYINTNCPPERQVKWYFDGRYLMNSQRNPDPTISPAGKVLYDYCLDAYGACDNCDVELTRCTGGQYRQFTVKVYPHQVDTNIKRVHFSIVSYLFPNTCLTRYPKNIRDIRKEWKACNDAKIVGSVFSFGIAAINWDWDVCKCAEGDQGNSERYVYKLQPCTGSPEQSFYLEHNWFAELDEMLKQING